MWTARDVQDRLRRELGHDRIVVKLLPKARPEDPDLQGRFVACVRVRRLTGRRSWPVTLCGDGSVHHGGETLLREVCDDDEIVYVHEDKEGRFLPLEPNVFRLELQRRDSHHRNLGAELKANIQAKRAAVRKRHDDEVRDRSAYYRKAFAKVARGEDVTL